MRPGEPLILIVGGGIGGLAFALAARQLGLEVMIWERAPELREVGAGLLLTGNALAVVKHLGLSEAVAAAGRRVRMWEILNRAGNVLQTFTSPSATPFSLSITRSAFQRTLRSPLADDVVWLDREVVALDPAAEHGKISVRSAHGNVCAADFVVGADGGKSRARAALFGDSALNVCSYVGWRALVDYVPDKWREGRITESWSDGCRFGIAPVSDTRSYWYATENVPPGWTIAPENYRAHLLKRFGHWHAPIAEMIEATPGEQILLNDIADHPRLPSWHRGRAGLLGDAAHLMTPNLGQGAAMALEDAWVLAQCVERFGCSEAAWDAFERQRRRRVTGIVWLSHLVGRMIQLENASLARLRDTALRYTPDALGRLALSPVFDFRV